MTSETNRISSAPPACHVPYTFTNVELLARALTHKSFHNEQNHCPVGDNERLEFLGDAVVGLALSDELMRRYPRASEGDLSKWRASLVNEASLADLAEKWRLGDSLRLGRGEVQSQGTKKPRILASAFEAMVGAIYLDAGYERTRVLLLEAFQEKLSVEFENAFGDLDYKTRLQEVTQHRFRLVPRYEVLQETGPDHDKMFLIEVRLGDKGLAQGRGRSKKQAAQEAAKKALEAL
jgi:ribonuclease-3